jgi:cytochrome c oxidase cbb3-type subunit 4
VDIGTFRGLITAVLFALFVALVIWAYSGRRRHEFEAAARLPFEDGDELEAAARRPSAKDDTRDRAAAGDDARVSGEAP